VQVLESIIGVFVLLISEFANREIAFVIAISILLGSIALWAIAVYVPHRRFRRAMPSAIRAAKTAVTDAIRQPADRIVLVDRVMSANPILAEAWVPYRSALRSDPRREDQFLNPVDPYGWFALDKLPGRGYEKWASTLAGVSLTVGLLFTFIGLSAALFKVGEAGSDTSALRDAIADILRISSAKFITSMAGIIAYIGWTLIARHYASVQGKLCLAFASAIQRLSIPVTPEALLVDQLEEARAQTAKFNTLADNIAMVFDSSLNRVLGARLDALPAAMGDALRPALESTVQPVVQAITQMGGSIGEGNHKAIEGLIGDLMKQLKDTTGREMEGLATSMKAAAAELQAAKDGISIGGSKFGQTLTNAAEGMSTASQRMAEALAARLGEIDKTLLSGATRIDDMGSKMSAAMAEGLQKALATIADSTNQGAKTARDLAEAELAPVLRELKTLIGDIKASADASRGALEAGGQSAAGDLKTAMGQVGAALSGVSAKVSEDLIKSSTTQPRGSSKAQIRHLASIEPPPKRWQPGSPSSSAGSPISKAQ
jgi:hypothetical protein